MLGSSSFSDWYGTWAVLFFSISINLKFIRLGSPKAYFEKNFKKRSIQKSREPFKSPHTVRAGNGAETQANWRAEIGWKRSEVRRCYQNSLSLIRSEEPQINPLLSLRAQPFRDLLSYLLLSASRNTTFSSGVDGIKNNILQKQKNPPRKRNSRQNDQAYWKRVVWKQPSLSRHPRLHEPPPMRETIYSGSYTFHLLLKHPTYFIDFQPSADYPLRHLCQSLSFF